jgi:acetyl esterase/lipase
MTTEILDVKTHEIDVEDIEYLRHGDKPLLARVFRPQGEGPFPALVECHGGAWCLSDRTTERLRHQAMAMHGIVSIALDFRSGNEDPYPASVQDINYAVRWTKLNARALKTKQTSWASRASRAAGTSPCSSPCGRMIRAIR